ncbi:MAG TPA: hypothetical protein VLA93_18025 [Pyrinomonadaceae bacterium]|nr:hypothetical protein [Pyrinomonadaceae bacterium]
MVRGRSSVPQGDYIIYPVMGFVIGVGAGAPGGSVFGAIKRERELIYQAP